jgi:beta-lactamase superfamily II metal-dependent hydrolase
LVIATHIDKDHIGGLKTVVQDFSVREFVINVPPAFEKTWFGLRSQLKEFRSAKGADRLAEAIDMVNDLLAELRAHGIKISGALQRRSWTCGDVTLAVLNPTIERLALAWQESELLQTIRNSQPHLGALLGALAEKQPTRPFRPSPIGNVLLGLGSPPPSRVNLNLAPLAGLLGQLPPAKSPAPKTSPENDSSIVLEIQYKGEPYGLMTSDCGAAVLKEVTEGKKYSFLKVPHHGSETGLDEELIKRWRPSTGYIPVGENPHGHPSLTILELLRKYGAKTYCSTKTKDCRKDCRPGGFGTLCHRKDKPFHLGWTGVDAAKCANNS